VNGDPYRSPQPADRRVINRSGQAYQRAEEPQPVKEEAPAPRTMPRSSGVSYHQEPEKRSKKGLVWTLVVGLLVLALAVAGWFMWSNAQSGATGINTSRFQAVFLNNGQIYFGKLSNFNDTSFKLTNIYYPQAQSTGEEEETSTQNAQSGIQLIRLGDEVHGPESEMFISKDQILYYENLKSDSKVSQLIQQNEKK
jgi:hypothetical protein